MVKFVKRKQLFLFLSLNLFLSCKNENSKIYNVLEVQINKGYDTIDLKEKFAFKWDRMVLAYNKEDVEMYLDEECSFLDYRNDISGMPAEKLSVIFINKRKIVYHEDTEFKYSGFDMVSGGFPFGFEDYKNGDIFNEITSDSALFYIKKISTNKGNEFILKPYYLKNK